MTTCIAAYTAVNPFFPAFVNISADGDDVIVTTRQQGDRHHHYPVTGVGLPKADAIALFEEALAALKA